MRHVAQEAAFTRIAHERFEQFAQRGLVHFMCAQLFVELLDALSVHFRIWRGDNIISTRRDEIRICANAFSSGAHDRLNRFERAIRSTNPAKLSIDHNRMRVFDDELTVVDIRLSHHRGRDALGGKLFAHTLVIQTGVVIEIRLHVDRAVLRPIAKAVRHESSVLLFPHCWLARSNRRVVAISIGLIERIGGGDIRISGKQRLQQLNRQRALAKQS